MVDNGLSTIFFFNATNKSLSKKKWNLQKIWGKQERKIGEGLKKTVRYNPIKSNFISTLTPYTLGQFLF